MAGATFLIGESKTRPGVYVRSANVGEAALAGVAQGTVAGLFRSSWGPLGEVVELTSTQDVSDTFGSAAYLDVALEALRGGASKILGYRLGTGGVVSTKTLDDTSTPTAVQAVRIDAKHVGTRGNDLKLTIRDSLTDTTKRELIVYEGTAVRQVVTFTKGATGDGEPESLVDAVMASNSEWITATKLADGNKLMAAVTQVTMASGADPTVVAADYSTALTAIEAQTWNVLAVDTEDSAVHSTIQTYIDRVRGEGKRVMAVVGEATSVALATRMTNAKALNHPAVVYVANGFEKSDGTTIEGYKAAARVAGMIAGSSITSRLTHAAVTSAVDLVGGLTNGEIETAITSGALVFTLSASGQVQIEYGITTLVTPNADQDDGWKKIRRVRTRDNLIDRIVATVDPLIGRVNNNAAGRATILAAINKIIAQMVAEGALESGEAKEDPAKTAAGDTAWFAVNVDDLDSMEKGFFTFGFRFSAA